MPKFPGNIAKPTVRLMTLQNCESTEAKFGLGVLETTAALVTPEHHHAFELDGLPVPPRRELHGMPWEGSDLEFRRFRRKLPPIVTPSSIYTHAALPSLQSPISGAQRTQEWHQARAFAITASSFSGASDTAASLLKTKTYPKTHGFSGNGFTEWGSLHEKHAEEAFVQFLKDRSFKGELEHPSHLRDATRPFLGFSPDALLWNEDRREVDLVEYKCPAARRSGPGHPYSSDKFCVPSRYMPQLQGSLLLLRAAYPHVRCVRAWFVAWQPHQFFVTHVPYVHLYASKTIGQAESFFHDRFLPACADAVLTRERVLLTFPSEEACFDFHETSDAMSPDTALRVTDLVTDPPPSVDPSRAEATSLTSSDAASSAASAANSAAPAIMF